MSKLGTCRLQMGRDWVMNERASSSGSQPAKQGMHCQEHIDAQRGGLMNNHCTRVEQAYLNLSPD